MRKETNKGSNDMPLGIVEESRFHPVSTTLRSGDMALLYTDALPESRDADGELLGIEGLNAVLDSIDATDPDRIISALLDRLASMSPKNLDSDDLTLMLLRATDTKVRLRDNLLALFRVIGDLAGIRMGRDKKNPAPPSTAHLADSATRQS